MLLIIVPLLLECGVCYVVVCTFNLLIIKLWFLLNFLKRVINDQVEITLEMQVAIFIVLAMTLRRKPDVLISLLPVIRETPKYQGQDKLPVIAWLIAQVSRSI